MKQVKCIICGFHLFKYVKKRKENVCCKCGVPVTKDEFKQAGAERTNV